MQVDGYSLDAQKDKLHKYADYQDMIIAGEYSDEGKSGKSVEGRPQFQQMLQDIESGKDKIDFVLVFKLSRFGRNAADVLSSLQRMQDFYVNLICVEDGVISRRISFVIEGQNGEICEVSNPEFWVYKNGEVVQKIEADLGSYNTTKAKSFSIDKDEPWSIDCELGDNIVIRFMCEDAYGLGYDFLLYDWSVIAGEDAGMQTVKNNDGNQEKLILHWSE